MKRSYIAPAALAIVVAGLLGIGLVKLWRALDNKYCQQRMHAIAFVARSLEEYKRTVGVYPAVFGREPLQLALRASTSWDTNLLSRPGLEYASNGHTYYLWYVPAGRGPIPRGEAVFMISDGKFSNYPDPITEAGVRRQEAWVTMAPDDEEH